MLDFVVGLFGVAFFGGLSVLIACASAYGALHTAVEIRKLWKQWKSKEDDPY